MLVKHRLTSFKVKYNNGMFRLKSIIFGYSTTRKILSSTCIGTANASRGRVWWVVALMLRSCAHVASRLWFIGVQRHENDVNSQIIPDNILDCEMSSVAVFRLLVMNMIPLQIRLCWFFSFQTLN